MSNLDVAEDIEISRAKSSALIGQAVNRSRLWSKAGLNERLFTFAFSSLVYPQIWEDPEVDLEAMQIEPGHRIITIASGSCNALSYLIADPAHVTAVDLNTAHIALAKLKIAAARRLASYENFYRLFGSARDAGNVDVFARELAPYLDTETRDYWQGRDATGRRRIARFARGFYRFGLLGRFIAAGHIAARLYGRDPRRLLEARNLAEQRAIYEQELAPLFEKPLVRRILDQRSSLFGLGIPPAQYDALSGGRPMHRVIEERLRRLACDFDLKRNYFAWQAFNRGYAASGSGPLPPYLEARHFPAIRERASRITVRHASFTEHLAGEPAGSFDRYVLLDAQDWMSDGDLTALWREITRTARRGARVIFRTAGEETILPGRVAPQILRRWHYEEEASRAFTRRDRSAIYGGFHLYVLDKESA